MLTVCPNCGAADQEAGKYCENCGYLLPAEGAVDASGAAPSTPPAVDGDTQTVPDAGAAPDVAAPPQATAATPAVTVKFAAVKDGQADPQDGFTITREGEFLVGRLDTESASRPDIDLRRWAQPLDIAGKQQYLVHRKQCYLGLTADGAATIKPCPGAEADTLVKAAGQQEFVALANFATVRPALPDGAFPLQPGDQIFMGDPETLGYYETGDPTAKGSYVIFELLPNA